MDPGPPREAQNPAQKLCQQASRRCQEALRGPEATLGQNVLKPNVFHDNKMHVYQFGVRMVRVTYTKCTACIQQRAGADHRKSPQPLHPPRKTMHQNHSTQPLKQGQMKLA
jgi:hypothetical protein